MVVSWSEPPTVTADVVSLFLSVGSIVIILDGQLTDVVTHWHVYDPLNVLDLRLHSFQYFLTWDHLSLHHHRYVYHPIMMLTLRTASNSGLSGWQYDIWRWKQMVRLRSCKCAGPVRRPRCSPLGVPTPVVASRQTSTATSTDSALSGWLCLASRSRRAERARHGVAATPQAFVQYTGRTREPSSVLLWTCAHCCLVGVRAVALSAA